MAFGLTDSGFNLKRLDDILDDLQSAINSIEDPETGERPDINLRGDDPLAQVIHTLADNNAQTWLVLQQVALAFDPGQNSGVAQSGAVQLNGITRNTGAPSTAPVTLTGTPGFVLSAGQRISDQQQNVDWLTTEELTFNPGGTVDATVQSSRNGAFTAIAGSLTTILTPQSGWSFVTNTADATPGSADEADTDLRVRRDGSTETPGIGPVDSIYGNLLNVDGVTFARVYQNITQTTDARGIPGKSIAPVIVGGDNDAIARALFERTPGVIGYHGNTSASIIDLQGESNIIEWFRPTEINIFIDADITITDPNLTFADVSAAIEAAVLVYVVSGAPGLGINNNNVFEQTGFVPGEAIDVSRFYTPFNSVAGHKVNTLEIGLSAGTTGTTSIPIAFNEIGAFDSARITITET